MSTNGTRPDRTGDCAVDLFAGPGGWDIAADQLGIATLGIEWDTAACATRHAADLPTIQGDVAQIDPHLFAEFDGLIGSPPCPAFSMAGQGAGRAVMRELGDAIGDALAGRHRLKHHRRRMVRTLKGVAARKMAARPRAERTAWAWTEAYESALIVQPARYIAAVRPRWVALEQVPPALDLWRVYADGLRGLGYSVWCGVLSSERYGVPQTRKRAILTAHRDRQVTPPAPTHQAYVPGEPAEGALTLEGEILPWVSMAEALGWGMTERPGMTFAPGTGNGGADYAGGSGARGILRGERDRGAWVDSGGCGDPLGLKGDDWPHRRPATVAGDPRVFQPGGHHGNGEQSHNAVRVTVEEAATLQGFPVGYPWQGSRTARFGQVGNAVPPPLARAVLAALTAG